MMMVFFFIFLEQNRLGQKNIEMNEVEYRSSQVITAYDLTNSVQHDSQIHIVYRYQFL